MLQPHNLNIYLAENQITSLDVVNLCRIYGVDSSPVFYMLCNGLVANIGAGIVFSASPRKALAETCANYENTPESNLARIDSRERYANSENYTMGEI